MGTQIRIRARGGITSHLCPHLHQLQGPSAHPNQEFLDRVLQLFPLLHAVHQHTAVQGKGREHGCSCQAPPLLQDTCKASFHLKAVAVKQLLSICHLKFLEMLHPGANHRRRALRRSLWEMAAGLIPGLLLSIQRGAPSSRLRGALQALPKLKQLHLSSMWDCGPGSSESIFRNIK